MKLNARSLWPVYTGVLFALMAWAFIYRTNSIAISGDSFLFSILIRSEYVGNFKPIGPISPLLYAYNPPDKEGFIANHAYYTSDKKIEFLLDRFSTQLKNDGWVKTLSKKSRPPNLTTYTRGDQRAELLLVNQSGDTLVTLEVDFR